MTKSTGSEKKKMTIGLDLGDRFSHFCVLGSDGEIVEEGRVATTRAGLEHKFSGQAPAVIAMEVGTHSPWASRLLKAAGHDVIVANARKLRFIFENRKKTDRVDARSLARVARFDRELLSGIEHRSEAVAQDLALLRARDILVRARIQLINHTRGAVKAGGGRLKKRSTNAFAKQAADELPETARESLTPVMNAISALTEQIRDADRRIEELGEKKYPETKLLRQVPGVGPLISLAFILTLENPERFNKSRMVGAYLGLVPSRGQSGSLDPQLRITKEGDNYLRKLLVQAAHHLIGPFGADSDLRRFGLELAARGGKNGRKRAIVGVARKLAVLLHHLWRSAEVYEPLYRASQAAVA